MALTEEDKKRLSVPQKAWILSATAAWDKANAAGDAAGMSAAAEAARKVRENAGYYSDNTGNFTGLISSIPTTVAPSGSSRSKLMSAQQLADKYGGINFDEDAILRKFNAATRAEYDLLRKEYGNVENQFGKKLSDIQGTALDTIRKANAAAIATGASRGVQAANELSAMLGLQDESALMATELAQQRQQLADKEAAALARNPVEALTAANAEKQKLATLAANIYAQDTMFDVGQMSSAAEQAKAEAMMEQALSAVTVQKLQNELGMSQIEANKFIEELRAEVSRYNSDKVLEGTIYNADRNLEGTLGAARINASTSGRSYNPNLTPDGTPASLVGFAPEVQALIKNSGLPADVVAGLNSNQTLNEVQRVVKDYMFSKGNRQGYVDAVMNYYNISRDEAEKRVSDDHSFLINEAAMKYGITPKHVDTNKNLANLNNQYALTANTQYKQGDIILNKDTGTLYRIEYELQRGLFPAERQQEEALLQKYGQAGKATIKVIPI